MNQFLFLLVTSSLASASNAGTGRSCSNLQQASQIRNNGKETNYMRFTIQHTIFLIVGIVCEGDHGTLSCPKNRFIHIRSADYGRVDNSKCQNGNYAPSSNEMNPTVPCHSDVKELIKRRFLFSKTSYFSYI